MFKELGYKKIFCILDGDKKDKAKELEKEYSKYRFKTISKDDIRDKKGKLKKKEIGKIFEIFKSEENEGIKKELENLDKEQVLKIAKDKSELLKKKADELLNLAKKKGTPVLEGIANDIKDKTIEVAKDVIEKLENSKE